MVFYPRYNKVNIYIITINHIINSKYFNSNINDKEKISSLLKLSKKVIIKFVKVNHNHNDLLDNYRELLFMMNLLDLNIQNKLEILYLFLNRYNKTPINKLEIKNKLFNLDNNKIISNNRFINWLFSK